jgi:hypothetical protein
MTKLTRPSLLLSLAELPSGTFGVEPSATSVVSLSELWSLEPLLSVEPELSLEAVELLALLPVLPEVEAPVLPEDEGLEVDDDPDDLRPEDDELEPPPDDELEELPEPDEPLPELGGGAGTVRIISIGLVAVWEPALSLALAFK